MSRFDVPTFIKWAGSKSQLLAQYDSLGLFPSGVDRYIEPFLGGGSMFFYIKQIYNPKEVFISDRNRELISCYQSVQKEPEKLIELLREHKANHSEKYYYKIRDSEINYNEKSNLEIAARFIYLNKTGFNGLYRINSKGKNNVPFGDYTNPTIFDKEIIKSASKVLQDVNINVMSYEGVLDIAKERNFVYFDPPYYPISSTSSFSSYTDIGFLADDHRRLANIFNELDKRKCVLMLSNSYCDYILDLYRNFNIEIVHVKRMINSDANGRKDISEIVVTNYEKSNRQMSVFDY